MHSTFSYCLLFTGILVLGCLDTINLNPDSGSDEAIIIDGRLVYGDTTEITVSIMTLFNFQANQSAPIPLESVRCYNDLGQHIDLMPVESGIYHISIPSTDDDFEVKTGIFYHIEVRTSQGTIFSSVPDQLSPIIAGKLVANRITKKLLNQIGTYDDVPFMAFSILMPLASGSNTENNRFKFSFERAFRLTDNTDKTCYAFQEFDIPNLVVFETRLLDSSITNVLIPLIDIKINHFFAEGYYLNLFQESLSQSAFVYWQDVQSLTIRTGNQFESPVGKVSTNVLSDNTDDQVFGYFYCTSEALSRNLCKP